MSDIETESKMDEAPDNDNRDGKKKKGWSVLYLPAFFIALITIALLFLMIFGTLFGNYQASDSDSLLLHTIDFTISEAAFDTPYFYLPSAAEEGEFVTGQGFRFETLDSQIRIDVPDYENNLSLEISFGPFNAKVYDSILENRPNFTVSVYSYNDVFLTSSDITNTNPSTKVAIDIVNDTAKYLILSYVHPITTIDNVEVMGYLYLKNLALYQINS